MRPVARKANLIVEDLSDEVILYDMDSKKAHCLNRSVGWIWKRCDGSRSIDDITAEFEQTFSVTDALPLVFSAIDQLAAANLLEGVSRSKPLPAAQMSRRAATVAFGASLLPVVTSIVAPTPAAAQSREPTDKDWDWDRDDDRDWDWDWDWDWDRILNWLKRIRN